jgi:hypothetical protein
VRANRLTQKKIGEETVPAVDSAPGLLVVGNRVLVSLGRPQRDGPHGAVAGPLKGTGHKMVNPNTVRGALSIAAAATFLSFAPREAFAQG